MSVLCSTPLKATISKEDLWRFFLQMKHGDIYLQDWLVSNLYFKNTFWCTVYCFLVGGGGREDLKCEYI
jgi:hypothetical protein